MHLSTKTVMTIGGSLLLLAGCSFSSTPTPEPSTKDHLPNSSVLPQAEPSKYVGTYHAVDSEIEYTMRVDKDLNHDSAVSVKITAMKKQTTEQRLFSFPVLFHGSNISGFSIGGDRGDQTNGQIRFQGNGVFMNVNESFTPFFFDGQQLHFVHSKP